MSAGAGATRLLLVRHGLTEWNLSRRYQGHSDTALCTEGLAQAEALARGLAGEPLAAVYSSDLRRALETATAIATRQGVAVHPDARLREISFGAWEGLTYAEITARYPREMAAWQADPGSVAPPGGETSAAVAARMAAAMHDIVAAHAEQTVVLASHGGALQLLLCHLLGIDFVRRWQLRLDQASVSEVDLYDGAAIVMSLNDRHYGREGAGGG